MPAKTQRFEAKELTATESLDTDGKKVGEPNKRLEKGKRGRNRE